MNLSLTNIKHLFRHKWIIDERPSKIGDFKVGWSSIYCYEKCVICGKEKDSSPFSKELTLQIEQLNINSKKLSDFICSLGRKK